jgi:hypothetical protein
MVYAKGRGGDPSTCKDHIEISIPPAQFKIHSPGGLEIDLRKLGTDADEGLIKTIAEPSPKSLLNIVMVV